MDDNKTSDTRKKLEADVQALTERWGRYGGKKSNYEKLFGTPERVARTFTAANDVCKTTQQCYPKCPLSAAPWCLGKRGSGDYDALLEWLVGIYV